MKGSPFRAMTRTGQTGETGSFQVGSRWGSEKLHLNLTSFAHPACRYQRGHFGGEALQNQTQLLSHLNAKGLGTFARSEGEQTS